MPTLTVRETLAFAQLMLTGNRIGAEQSKYASIYLYICNYICSCNCILYSMFIFIFIFVIIFCFLYFVFHTFMIKQL
jgi:hypothetical protein